MINTGVDNGKKLVSNMATGYYLNDDEYSLPAYPINENTLHHTWIDEEYTFTKDEDGQVYLWGIRKKNNTFKAEIKNGK